MSQKIQIVIHGNRSDVVVLLHDRASKELLDQLNAIKEISVVIPERKSIWITFTHPTAKSDAALHAAVEEVIELLPGETELVWPRTAFPADRIGEWLKWPR